MRDLSKDEGKNSKQGFERMTPTFAECPSQRLWAVGRADLSSSHLLEPLCHVSIEELSQGGTKGPHNLAVQCCLRARPST